MIILKYYSSILNQGFVVNSYLTPHHGNISSVNIILFASQGINCKENKIYLNSEVKAMEQIRFFNLKSLNIIYLLLVVKTF